MQRIRTAFDKPERAFLVLALLFGLPLIFIYAPFQSPDEQRHFFRALQVAQGHALPLRTNTYVADVPASAAEVVAHYMGLPFRPERKTSAEQIWSDLSVPLQPGRRAEVECAGSYPPTAYLAHALPMALGYLIGLPALWLFYLGRLGGFLACVALIYFALKLAVRGRAALFLIALMPMTLSQMVVVSCDTHLFGCCFLMFALLTRAFADPEFRIDRRFLGVMAALALFIGASKPVYLTLPLLLLAMPLKKAGGWKRLGGVYFGLSSVGALGYYLWVHARALVVATLPPLAEAVSPGAQANLAGEQPWRFVALMLENFDRKGYWYLETFIGQPGWLDTHLPVTAVLIYFAALVAVSLAHPGEEPIDWRPRVLGFFAFAGATTLITYHMFLWYNAPGGFNNIEGIQGRYMIPVAPALSLALTSRALRTEIPEKTLWRGCSLFCAGALVLLVRAMLNRYYYG